MSEDTKKAFLAAVGSDLGVFIQQAFGAVYPGKQFEWNWHIAALCYQLKLALEGKNPRLIVNLPPRHLKSFLITVAFVAFVLGRDPSARIICISYSDELSKALTRDFRRIIETNWYRSVFPAVQIAKATEAEIVTTMGGGRFATSVGGTLTGRGGDIIIIDDPIKPDEAYSEKIRKSVNDWYASTLFSRLDDKTRSLLIVVMQRVHMNDLSGFLDAGGGFVKLAFSAIATRDEPIAIAEDEIHLRSEGEVLHEARENLEVLERLRKQMGEHNFWAQYQQQPQAPEGSMFKRSWFGVADQPPARQPDGQIYISVDTALSTSETADYTAISVVYVDQRGYWVLSAERGHWDYDYLRRHLIDMLANYSIAPWFIVEATGVGLSLIPWLKTRGHFCLSYTPKLSKEARAYMAMPDIHAKRVTLVRSHSCDQWIEPYLNEFCAFPFGRFDDWVDSLVQLINWASKRHGVGRDPSDYYLEI